MFDDFESCAKGGAVFSLFVAIVAAIIKDFPTSIMFFFGYNVVSWVMFGIYAWTKKELKYNAGVFVAGTIIVTGGGWWMMYLIAIIMVKINMGIANLINH